MELPYASLTLLVQASEILRHPRRHWVNPIQPVPKWQSKSPIPVKEIVRAWLDDAINPLIAVLKQEEKLLDDELWTWNHKLNKFERLDYFCRATSFEGNIGNFLERYPSILELLKLHDDSLTALNNQAGALFRELSESS